MRRSHPPWAIDGGNPALFLHPSNKVNIITSDGEWFPVAKKLLRPCIALTKVSAALESPPPPVHHACMPPTRLTRRGGGWGHSFWRRWLQSRQDGWV